MNNPVAAGQISALLVIIAGALTCFSGYRLLKVALGILGFISGAYGGWELGVSLAHTNNAIALVCALVGGLIGMALYVWLYFLGVFLLGATAGTIATAAFYEGTGHQPQPIVLLVVPVISGLLALVAQKLMIVVCTAFSGSYLITAGIWLLVAGRQNPPRIWLHPDHFAAPGTLGYAALALWVVLGLVGMSVQFRTRTTKAEPAEKQK